MKSIMQGDRVRFEKPDWNLLSESGLMYADMHFHTEYSDSYTSVGSALKLAAKRGVGFAITDHNLIGGVLKAYEEKGPDQFIVPGIEISSWDGPHILVYFYTLDEMKEYWERNVSPHLHSSNWLAIDKGTEWILDSLEGVNHVVSAAHPLGYFASVKGVQKAIDKGILDKDMAYRFDAYEAICSGMFRSENKRARDCAEEYGIGITGGTDGHIIQDLGKVLCISEASDLDGFLDNIKSKRNIVIGREKMFSDKVLTALASGTRFCTCLPSSIERKMQLTLNSGTKEYVPKRR